MSAVDDLALTVYLEARGEPADVREEGWEWIAWVVKNRAAKQRSYWGYSISEVCRKPGQFECYSGRRSTRIDPNERHIYDMIYRICRRVVNAPLSHDPTGGCDHYNNPDKEGYPAWTQNVRRVRKIGNHVFYRGD